VNNGLVRLRTQTQSLATAGFPLLPSQLVLTITSEAQAQALQDAANPQPSGQKP